MVAASTFPLPALIMPRLWWIPSTQVTAESKELYEHQIAHEDSFICRRSRELRGSHSLCVDLCAVGTGLPEFAVVRAQLHRRDGPRQFCLGPRRVPKRAHWLDQTRKREL